MVIDSFLGVPVDSSGCLRGLRADARRPLLVGGCCSLLICTSAPETNKKRPGAEHRIPQPLCRAGPVSSELILRRGPDVGGAAAAARLRPRPGFWIHVDLDVLSSAVPAVDYPQPGRLDADQLQDLLRPLTTAPRFRGMDVTILNPTKDPDGSLARRVVQIPARALA